MLLCSDSAEAKHEVAQLAQCMGFYPVDVGSLCCAQDLERKPLHFFPSWHGPVLTTFLLFLFFYCYGFICRILLPYLSSEQNSFYRLVFDLVNESLPCVALVTLALVYLPGLFAAWLQLWRGTKYQCFPYWLDAWLLRRKQLGLLSFLCAALHGVYSLCLPLRTITRHRLINAAYSQVLIFIFVSFLVKTFVLTNLTMMSCSLLCNRCPTDLWHLFSHKCLPFREGYQKNNRRTNERTLILRVYCIYCG